MKLSEEMQDVLERIDEKLIAYFGPELLQGFRQQAKKLEDDCEIWRVCAGQALTITEANRIKSQLSFKSK